MLKIAQAAINWLLSFWSWRLVAEHGRHAYFENDVSGARKARKVMLNAGVHPAHDKWLAGGDWSYERPKPPREQSSMKRSS
jgi:hypothetical protein